jgi:hypothetical protein
MAAKRQERTRWVDQWSTPRSGKGNDAGRAAVKPAKSQERTRWVAGGDGRWATARAQAASVVRGCEAAATEPCRGRSLAAAAARPKTEPRWFSQWSRPQVAATNHAGSASGQRREAAKVTTLGQPAAQPRSGNHAGSGTNRTVGGLGGSAPQCDDGGARRSRVSGEQGMETPQCCQVGGPPALRGQLGHREALRGRYSVTKKVLSLTGDPWSGAAP